MSTGTTYFSQGVIERGRRWGVVMEKMPLVGIHGNLVLSKHAVMSQLWHPFLKQFRRFHLCGHEVKLRLGESCCDLCTSRNHVGLQRWHSAQHFSVSGVTFRWKMLSSVSRSMHMAFFLIDMTERPTSMQPWSFPFDSYTPKHFVSMSHISESKIDRLCCFGNTYISCTLCILQDAFLQHKVSLSGKKRVSILYITMIF